MFICLCLLLVLAWRLYNSCGAWLPHSVESQFPHQGLNPYLPCWKAKSWPLDGQESPCSAFSNQGCLVVISYPENSLVTTHFSDLFLSSPFWQLVCLFQGVFWMLILPNLSLMFIICISASGARWSSGQIWLKTSEGRAFGVRLVLEHISHLAFGIHLVNSPLGFGGF